MVLGALVGLAGAGLQYKAGKDAADKNEELFKLAQAQQRKDRNKQMGLERLARVQNFKGLHALREGYGDARSRVASQGAVAHRYAERATTGNVGRANASAVSRGLYNTSAGQSMASRAQFQGAQAHGDIASRLAGLMANLDAAEAGDVAGQRNQIAQSYVNSGRSAVQNSSQLTNLLGQTQYGSDSSIAPLAGSLGAFLDAWLAKKGGGSDPVGGFNLGSLFGGK